MERVYYKGCNQRRRALRPSTPFPLRKKGGSAHEYFTKGLYAVRLWLYLAEHDGGGPVSLKEVSESLGISKKYLEQIVSNVVTAKLVRSVRGAARRLSAGEAGQRDYRA